MFDSANLSVLAVPAHYFIAMGAHAYAIQLAKNKWGRWDNRNPRSPEYRSILREKLGPDTYAAYERAEAASANGFENFPILASAVILGNMANLPKEGLGGMNGFAVSYIAIRFLYTLSYVKINNVKTSYLRTLLYLGGMGLCLRTIFKAAFAL